MKIVIDIPSDHKTLYVAGSSAAVGVAVCALALQPSAYAVAGQFLWLPVAVATLIGAAAIGSDGARRFVKATMGGAKAAVPQGANSLSSSGFGRKFDPNTSDPNLAPALTPRDWALARGVSVLAGTVDEVACARALADQVGPRWSGLRGAPLHARSLAVLFGVHGVKARTGREESDAEGLRRKVAIAHANLKGEALRAELDLLLAPWLLDEHFVSTVDRVASKHAFVATALLKLLTWARIEGGILAAAEFLWLKEADRTLYYALNNLGRSAHHVEGLGAYAHYAVECFAAEPVAAPAVEAGVRGMQEYFDRLYPGRRPDAAPESTPAPAGGPNAGAAGVS